MNDAILQWLLRHRRAVALALLGITVAFATQLPRVAFDNTIESYFLDEDIADYDAFLEQFGTDEVVALAFAADDVFSPDSLELIDTVSRRLKALPHVRRVLSLTESEVVQGEGDRVDFSDLVTTLDPDAAQREQFRQRALHDPFLPGLVLSPDSRRTAVVAEIDHLIGQFDYKVDLLASIRAIAADAQARSGLPIHIAGAAVLDDALFRYTERDQAVFMPLMLVLIVVVLAMIFRSLRVVLVPLLVVVMTTVWTYGLLVLLGYKVNVVSTIIPPLLLAVAIADSIHLIADYLQHLDSPGGTPESALGHSFHNIALPCVMTTATTVAGLLSLLVADLTPIREFGLLAACGVAFALIITIALLPLLPLLVPRVPTSYDNGLHRGALAAVLAFLGHWSPRRGVLVLAASAALAVAGLILLPRLGLGTNSLDFFKRADPVRLGTLWIDAGIGGTSSLEFHIHTDQPDALKEPDLLRKMVTFQDYLETLDGITGVYSSADFVRTLNRAFSGGDPDSYRIPESRALIAQELLLVEGSDDLRALVSDDYSQGRITARVEMDRARQLAHRMPEILARMDQVFGATPVTPTGLVYLMNRMEHYLLSSQINSFLLAFAVIASALLLLMRSWRLGLIAIVPNVLPILLTMGLMVLLHVRLDISTVMIAAIVLGLIVDDTIHFTMRWRREMEVDGDPALSIRRSIDGVGRPLVFTSVVLCGGFAVLVLASFAPIINFGLLATAAIAMALAADLLLLPALLGLFVPGRDAADH